MLVGSIDHPRRRLVLAAEGEVPTPVLVAPFEPQPCDVVGVGLRLDVLGDHLPPTHHIGAAALRQIVSFGHGEARLQPLEVLGRWKCIRHGLRDEGRPRLPLMFGLMLAKISDLRRRRPLRLFVAPARTRQLHDQRPELGEGRDPVGDNAEARLRSILCGPVMRQQRRYPQCSLPFCRSRVR